MQKNKKYDKITNEKQSNSIKLPNYKKGTRMIAEIVINRSAKRLNRTFDYGIPKELEELVMIGSTVLVPFGKSSSLEEGYVVGIKENSGYEVKDIVKIKHNLTEKQIELAKWMAKRYFCNVSDCIKQMLTPGTKNKNTGEVCVLFLRFKIPIILKYISSKSFSLTPRPAEAERRAKGACPGENFPAAGP